MDDFPWLDRLKGLQAAREMPTKVAEAIRAREESQDRDLVPSQVLLVLEVCIQRHEHIKIQFPPAPRARHSLFLTIPLPERCDTRGHVLRDTSSTLLECIRQSALSFKLGDNASTRFFNGCDSEFAAYTRVLLQKVV